MKTLRPGVIASSDMDSRFWAGWTRDQPLEHGTYTPPLTNGTNVDESTANECQFSRSGSLATVIGSISVTALGAGATDIDIAFPIPSTLGASAQCVGTGFTSSGIAATVLGDIGAAKLAYTAAGAGALTVYFSFIYRVIP